MANASNDHVNRDPETDLNLDSDEVVEGDALEKRIDAGQITEEQADELMQKAARRDIAEHGPDRLPDEGGSMTQSVPGQGMASQSRKRGHKS